jgi:hemoglobin
MDLLDTQIFEVIGEAGLRRLVAAFYRRVPNDPMLGAMYPKADLAGAEERLREFLIQRFGGPDHYSQKRGHPRLRMRHAPFKVDQQGRDRWIELMEAAMVEADMPATVVPALRKLFHDAGAFMINHTG